MSLQVKENLMPPIVYSFDGEIYYPESDGEPMAETDIHAKLLIYLKQSLDIFFADREDVYVTGNIMFYYVEGDPTEFISPDVMVCFGIPKGDRTSYKTWEESNVSPSVVIEIASRSTWKKDRIEKRELYESLGVKEYYIFNPLYLKALPAFLAFRSDDFELKHVEIKNGKIFSEILGLELVDTGETLRLLNPNTGEFLKDFEELSEENSDLKAEIERLNKMLQNR